MAVSYVIGKIPGEEHRSTTRNGHI